MSIRVLSVKTDSSLAIWRRSWRKVSKRAELRLEFAAVVPADEPTLEAEKLSFSNGFLRFFEADIFSFSLNFFTIILIFFVS